MQKPSRLRTRVSQRTRTRRLFAGARLPLVPENAKLALGRVRGRQGDRELGDVALSKPSAVERAVIHADGAADQRRRLHAEAAKGVRPGWSAPPTGLTPPIRSA